MGGWGILLHWLGIQKLATHQVAGWLRAAGAVCGSQTGGCTRVPKDKH